MSENSSNDITVKIGIVALQGNLENHAEAVATAIENYQEETQQPFYYEISFVKTSDEIKEQDALVFPGGESTSMRRLASMMNLEDTIKEFADNGGAILATCAGLIWLSDDIYLSSEDDNASKGIGVFDIATLRNTYGRQSDSFESELTVKDEEHPSFHGIFIRAPGIKEVRGDTIPLATIGDGTVVAVQKGGLIGTTFHPEMTDDPYFHTLLIKSVIMKKLA